MKKTIVTALLGATLIVLVAAEPSSAAATTWQAANSNSTGDQDVPAIAMNRTGYVAVVWADDRDTTAPDNDVHSEVYLRLFRDGTPVYETKLSAGGTAGTNWKHINPDVGLDDAGNAVVVWSDDPDGNGFYNVPYRVVSVTGTVRASGRVNASADGQQLNPKVAVDPDGVPTSTTGVAFSAVWEDIQGTAAPRVKAAGYTNLTTKAYEVFVSPATGTHHRPDVAVSASGEAIVVWDDDADGNGFYTVDLVKLAKANGAVTLSRRPVNVNGAGQQFHAAVAATFAGDFTVAWESDHTGVPGVWARSFTATGAPRHDDVEVSSGTGASRPAIGIDDQANVVVGWTVAAADLDVWVRGLGPDGTPAGKLPAQRYSQVTAGRQEGLVVGVSAWGEVSVAYTDDNDGNTFDQIILGVGAANTA